MTIEGLLDNARQLQSDLTQGSIIRDVLEPHGAEIVDQQRTQLLMGKGSDGQDIHPFYSEDLKPQGYFKSSATAANYRGWKQELSYPKNVQRNPDAPNLYITGVFHNDLNVSFGADALSIVPDTAYAANIMAKYGLNIFGLSWESWGVIWNERGAKDELITKVKSVLWQ
jgi:hypothetical protein